MSDVKNYRLEIAMRIAPSIYHNGLMSQKENEPYDEAVVRESFCFADKMLRESEEHEFRIKQKGSIKES